MGDGREPTRAPQHAYAVGESETDGVERLLPKLPELAEFVRTIPDLAPSQCFSPLQRCGSRSTSSIRSWLGERTTRTAEVRGVEASDDSSAGSKALAKFVRKRTIQPPAPSASAISTFAAQNGIWRLAWPGEEAVGLLPPNDLFQEDPGWRGWRLRFQVQGAVRERQKQEEDNL